MEEQKNNQRPLDIITPCVCASCGLAFLEIHGILDVYMVAKCRRCGVIQYFPFMLQQPPVFEVSITKDSKEKIKGKKK